MRQVDHWPDDRFGQTLMKLFWQDPPPAWLFLGVLGTSTLVVGLLGWSIAGWLGLLNFLALEYLVVVMFLLFRYVEHGRAMRGLQDQMDQLEHEIQQFLQERTGETNG